MGKRGLWDNIHAKRKRIARGSGERMRKPGSEGAPTAEALKRSQVSEAHITPSPKEIADKFSMTMKKVMEKIKAGGRVEKEHTNNEKMAKKIARDHLRERPDYYQKLKKMEKTPVSEGCGCEDGTPEYTERHMKNTPGQRAKKIKEIIRKKK
jgi:hypothetical protein